MLAIINCNSGERYLLKIKLSLGGSPVIRLLREMPPREVTNKELYSKKIIAAEMIAVNAIILYRLSKTVFLLYIDNNKAAVAINDICTIPLLVAEPIDESIVRDNKK